MAFHASFEDALAWVLNQLVQSVCADLVDTFKRKPVLRIMAKHGKYARDNDIYKIGAWWPQPSVSALPTMCSLALAINLR